MGLFGKSAPPDPKEQVKEWSKKLRKERNALDRQINQIKREEQKAVNSIKQSTLSKSQLYQKLNSIKSQFPVCFQLFSALF